MKTGTTIHGFKVEESFFVKESDAALYTLSHKSGARLAFLDRADDNKTFSISFLTPPEDSTGVFHIIEHSTLCGSEKFPIKEPFVELLKGSLNTFLNAMTYEDRTVYPVSSRCDRDFYNLVNVYLDAVFFPLMKKNRFIFEQEGWRYEYDEDSGKLSYNGVVYNEMKGAYSSPDEIGYSEISRLLFEGSSYGEDSGGNPEHIPSLTYESFCRLHEKYYHPSNAYIYLDGSVELDSILPLIGSYLDRFERREEGVTLSPVIKSGKRCSEVCFEASGDDSKARLILGYPFSDHSKTDDKILSSVILAHLCGSNEAPLTKALLDSGLAEDVSLSINYSAVYTLTAEIKGIELENKDRILDIFNSVIEKECLGMDKRSLHASLNRTEFKLRERDLGSFPIGVANALSVYELWSYGAKPECGLVFEDDIAKLRQGIDSGAAEALLAKMIKDNGSSAEVLMLPSTSAARENEERLAAFLSDKLHSFTKAELDKLKSNQEKFKEWQHSPDSEEALASLPELSLADISPNVRQAKAERFTFLGADIISADINTRGITYLSMFFDGSDLSEREISELSLLSTVLTNLNTKKHSVTELRNEIRSSLGSFTAVASVIANSKKGFTKPVLKLTASALDQNSDGLKNLICEVLLETRFDDSSAVKKLIVQSLSELEDMFASNGETVAMGRVEAMSSPHGRISELIHGYDYYLSLKEFLKETEESPKKFMSELEALAKKLFVKQRLTLSIATKAENLERELIEGLADGGSAPFSSQIEKLTPEKEGIAIPSRVGYAVSGSLHSGAKSMLGALRVVRQVLSYEYLWNEVRVKGGAYGSGFVTRRDGGLYFYSYRDPSPKRSLSVFDGSSAYLRKIAESGVDLTKFIIGAYGEYDILRTPKTAFAQLSADILTDWTNEDERALREGLIGTTHEDIFRAAELLGELKKTSSIAISAKEDVLSSFEKLFDKILKI